MLEDATVSSVQDVVGRRRAGGEEGGRGEARGERREQERGGAVMMHLLVQHFGCKQGSERTREGEKKRGREEGREGRREGGKKGGRENAMRH
eukprot:3169254-Rhodomonas_salina.1